MMRLLATLLGCAIVAACATTPRVPNPLPANAKVAVVVSSALTPGHTRMRTMTHVLGETPAEVAAREVPRAVQGRFQVVSTRIAPRPVEVQVGELTPPEGAEATLVVMVMGMDHGVPHQLGAGTVDVWTRLIGKQGETLWEARRREPTLVANRQSPSDWRIHLRMALRQALDELR